MTRRVQNISEKIQINEKIWITVTKEVIAHRQTPTSTPPKRICSDAISDN